MAGELEVLERCQRALPAWRSLTHDQFEFSPPRGFSSFTMAVRCLVDVEPRAVLYRHLGPKPNALLGYSAERAIYEALDAGGVAAQVLAYEADHRIEAFYDGRSLGREDLEDHAILGQIGERLASLHAVRVPVPQRPFFDLAHERWGPVAHDVLTTQRACFAPNEQELCEQLLPLVHPETLALVHAQLPRDEPSFCHNDTYHGNIMLLGTGQIRLLDFEFSCLNHRAFDFANLFSETVMRHKLPEYPFFRIVEPTYDDDDIAAVVEGYLRHSDVRQSVTELVAQTRRLIPLSDYMYALAATTLAVEPIQKIRFIPYAYQRFRRFLEAVR